MATTTDEPKVDHIILTNVRLSFPHLWKAKAMEGEEDTKAKFQAAFLLEKEGHAELIKLIKVMMFKLALTQFGDNPLTDAGKEKVKKMFADKTIKVCLHEGTSKDYDGYTESNMFLSATAKTRPSVVDRDHTPLAEEDGRPYAGCYVNAAVQLWVQDNKWGKRVNCELRGVQFVKDGEAFGKPPFDPTAAFPKLDKEKAPGGAPASSGAVADDEIPF